MDTHPHLHDDMSDLERRLAGWAPASAGLDADAMLYAAGLAAGRAGPARFVWPALSGMLSLVVVALGAWFALERGERLHLAQQLRQRSPVPSISPSPEVAPAESLISDDVASSSYLAAHLAMSQGREAWPAAKIDRTDVSGSPMNLPILQVGQRDALLDQ